ncbi:MAG: MFS transporter [Gammaproteobacteria bacterium]|nr:MFS transporter [Gammaproteobacteria bacterium]
MLFPYLTRNVWLLCLAQVFAFTGTNVTIFLGGIIGSLLTPTPVLATLPVALMIVGITSGTVPAAMLMSVYGRRLGFVSAAIIACAAALLGAWAIALSSFWLYCLACFSMGASVAFVQQYRFAAAESVSAEYAPQAISAILLAGIAGAFLGPNIANLSKDLVPDAAFVGSYLALALMVLMPALILSWLTDADQQQSTHTEQGRSLSKLARQPDFILAIMAAGISYGLMSFLMTATPISMHVMDGHSLYHTGMVIQWHIVGMFLPSLFTGKLISRYGYHSIAK